MTKNDGAYGVVEKRKESAFRYAIRFRNIEALQELATKHSIPETQAIWDVGAFLEPTRQLPHMDALHF